MACYIVSYDLRKQRNYDALYEAIKSYGTWAHILESVWAIVTSHTAAEVREHLSKFTDSDDGLFVIKSGKEAAWIGVTCKNEWLKQNV
jgi:hypothetical protein